MLVAGDTEAQHTQDLKATTSPVVAPGGTSHQFPASHIPLLPLWGCLCPPPSLPLPFQHWILEAAHWTERGRLYHIPEGCSFCGWEPHPGAPRCPTSVLHNTGIASTLEPFLRGKRWSLAWKGGLCLDLLEVVHWSCCSFCSAQGHFPQTSQRLPDLPTDTFLWEHRRRSSFDIIPPLLYALKSHIHVGYPGLDGKKPHSGCC